MTAHARRAQVTRPRPARGQATVEFVLVLPLVVVVCLAVVQVAVVARRDVLVAHAAREAARAAAVEADDSATHLRFCWREDGGPPVVPPTRRGFGSRLIERSLARDLDGRVTIHFEPKGVVCTIAAPLP